MITYAFVLLCIDRMDHIVHDGGALDLLFGFAKLNRKAVRTNTINYSRHTSAAWISKRASRSAVKVVRSVSSSVA